MDLERTIKIAHFAIEIYNSVINYQANPQKNSRFQSDLDLLLPALSDCNLNWEEYWNER
jgi:hypothetical protein